MPENPYQPPKEVGTGRPFNWNIVKVSLLVCAGVALAAVVSGIALVAAAAEFWLNFSHWDR